MVHVKRKTGNEGENIASKFLQKRGYEILEKNYQRKWGEIDIIAVKDGIVHFVEVKAVVRETEPLDFSREIEYRPEELVHRSKLKKLARTASLYMDERGDNREFQLDVVGVIMNKTSRIARCRLFEQALEENL